MRQILIIFLITVGMVQAQTPTFTPSVVSTSIQTSTVTPTLTPTPSFTATPTFTATFPTYTPTLSPTNTPTPTITITPTVTFTVTLTPTFTATCEPVLTAEAVSITGQQPVPLNGQIYEQVSYWTVDFYSCGVSDYQVVFGPYNSDVVASAIATPGARETAVQSSALVTPTPTQTPEVFFVPVAASVMSLIKPSGL
jgi:hypothetical protein